MILINCNTKGEINIDDNARFNGISITLVDEKHAPIARYEFDSRKMSNLTKLSYNANNVRMHFYDEITPTMKFEFASA